MSRRHRDLLLWCAIHDDTFTYSREHGGHWTGKCLHCNRKIAIATDGKPMGGASLEHIVPRTHGGGNAPENLGIACMRCNGQKGRKVDVLPRHHPTLLAMIERLRTRREERLREPPNDGAAALAARIKHHSVDIPP